MWKEAVFSEGECAKSWVSSRILRDSMEATKHFCFSSPNTGGVRLECVESIRERTGLILAQMER